MGNINMRALEIYEELVKEHQILFNKTNKIKDNPKSSFLPHL